MSDGVDLLQPFALRHASALFGSKLRSKLADVHAWAGR